MPIDAKTTALLLIEYQNDFTTEGGALHDGVKSVMATTDMLKKSVELAAAARKAGVQVMYAPITFAEGYNEITSHPYGILKGVVDTQAFRKGTWGAEIVEVMRPQPGDIVIEGKRGLDTFASTNLDFILRSKGIQTLIVAGFLSNCCVESTGRTGYERGFQVIAVADCAATLSEEAQKMTYEVNLPMFARIVNSEEIIKEFSL